MGKIPKSVNTAAVAKKYAPVATARLSTGSSPAIVGVPRSASMSASRFDRRAVRVARGIPEPLTARKTSKDCGGDCGCKGCGDKPGAMLAGSRRFANAPSAQQASALAKGPVFTGRAQKSRAPDLRGAREVDCVITRLTPEQITWLEMARADAEGLHGWPGTMPVGDEYSTYDLWIAAYADHVATYSGALFADVAAATGLDLYGVGDQIARTTDGGRESWPTVCHSHGLICFARPHWGVAAPTFTWCRPIPIELTPVQRGDLVPASPPRFEDDPRLPDDVRFREIGATALVIWRLRGVEGSYRATTAAHLHPPHEMGFWNQPTVVGTTASRRVWRSATLLGRDHITIRVSGSWTAGVPEGAVVVVTVTQARTGGFSLEPTVTWATRESRSSPFVDTAGRGQRITMGGVAANTGFQVTVEVQGGDSASTSQFQFRVDVTSP